MAMRLKCALSFEDVKSQDVVPVPLLTLIRSNLAFNTPLTNPLIIFVISLAVPSSSFEVSSFGLYKSKVERSENHFVKYSIQPCCCYLYVIQITNRQTLR